MNKLNTKQMRIATDSRSSPRRLIPLAKHVPPGRTFHLVDIENLMGGPLAGEERLRWAVFDYQAAVSAGELDPVVVGSNPQIGDLVYVAWQKCIDINDTWPVARLVVRKGPDGADEVLLEEVKNHGLILKRYDRILIGSGDGIFAPVAEAYRSYGLIVGVVSRKRSLSAALREAASFVRFIPDYDDLAA